MAVYKNAGLTDRLLKFMKWIPTPLQPNNPKFFVCFLSPNWLLRQSIIWSCKNDWNWTSGSPKADLQYSKCSVTISCSLMSPYLCSSQVIDKYFLNEWMNLVSIALTKFLKIQSSTLQTLLWILSPQWFPSHLILILAIETHNLVFTFVDSVNKCSLDPYYIALPKHWADKQRWIEHRLTSNSLAAFYFIL